MAIDRSQFEWLFLHSRLLPDLALSLTAQDILETPRSELAAAVQGAGSEDALQSAPGDAVDWFGASGLSDEQLRELRESAERELATFDGAASQRPAAAVTPAPGLGDEPLDLDQELELAYAQHDAVAADAQAAFERVDRSRLDALLAAVAGGGATLTDRMDVADLAGWLQFMQDDDAALNNLLNYVLETGEA